MNHLLAGAIAGFAATVPMTWAMNRMFRRLPEKDRYPLPPRLITERVAESVGIASSITESRMKTASLASHYAYGAVTGVACGPLLRLVGGSPVAVGIGYGLGVWAVSYLGWIPAAGILRPATVHPRERVALMLAAHVVWGGATGYLTAQLADGRRALEDGEGAEDGWTAQRTVGSEINRESAAPEEHRYRFGRQTGGLAVEKSTLF
jgi:hypothetical protein